jgi:hypothetical protein
MLRLLREAQNDAICGDQYVEQVDKNTLDARVLNSMAASGSTHHMYDGARHG